MGSGTPSLNDGQGRSRIIGVGGKTGRCFNAQKPI
jgi:hypothetical protein